MLTTSTKSLLDQLFCKPCRTVTDLSWEHDQPRWNQEWKSPGPSQGNMDVSWARTTNCCESEECKAIQGIYGKRQSCRIAGPRLCKALKVMMS